MRFGGADGGGQVKLLEQAQLQVRDEMPVQHGGPPGYVLSLKMQRTRKMRPMSCLMKKLVIVSIVIATARATRAMSATKMADSVGRCWPQPGSASCSTVRHLAIVPRAVLGRLGYCCLKRSYLEMRLVG